MITELYDVAHRAYRFHILRERHRALVFMARGLLHQHQLRELYEFFQETEVRRALYARNPFPMEQATRAFFLCRVDGAHAGETHPRALCLS